MARSTASLTAATFMEEGLARMVQPSVPHTTSLQKATAASTKAAGSGAVRAVSASSPKNDSTLKQMSSVWPGGTSRMNVQGSASAGPRPGSLAPGGGDLGQRLGQRAEKGFALGPSRVGDDDPRRNAVEAGVVDQHGGHVLRLVAQIGHRPLARNHDDRRHVAELGTHGLVERRLVGGLASGAFGAGAE